MPAATPAEVSTRSSAMKSTSGSRSTRSCRRRNRSAYAQWVVARRPSRSPAAASTNAPVQIDMIRAPRSYAARSASITSGSTVPEANVELSWMPGTITVSAVSSSSRPWSGSTWKPPVLRTGCPPGVHTRTS